MPYRKRGSQSNKKWRITYFTVAFLLSWLTLSSCIAAPTPAPTVAVTPSPTAPPTLTPMPGIEIPFSVIVSDFEGKVEIVIDMSSNAPLPKVENTVNPTIRVITQLEEVNQLSPYISYRHLDKLEQIDYDSCIVLIAHRGQTSSLYPNSIEVGQVRLVGDQLHIITAFNPANGQASEIVTYPVEIVQIPRLEKPIQEYQILLVVDGEILDRYP